MRVTKVSKGELSRTSKACDLFCLTEQRPEKIQFFFINTLGRYKIGEKSYIEKAMMVKNIKNLKIINPQCLSLTLKIISNHLSSEFNGYNFPTRPQGTNRSQLF